MLSVDERTQKKYISPWCHGHNIIQISYRPTMGLMNFTLKRLAPAAGATALTAFCGITTLNDDWDDYFHSSITNASSSNQETPEKIVILGSGWAALSALRKCASPNKSIVVVSPRPHFLYTPLLASSSVGTITLRSACERKLLSLFDVYCILF